MVAQPTHYKQTIAKGALKYFPLPTQPQITADEYFYNSYNLIVEMYGNFVLLSYHISLISNWCSCLFFNLYLPLFHWFLHVNSNSHAMLAESSAYNTYNSQVKFYFKFRAESNNMTPTDITPIHDTTTEIA